MNKIDLIKKEFPTQFELAWENRTGIQEYGVQNPDPLFDGRATHCKSTLYTLVKILKPRTVLEIGSWTYQSANAMSMAMDDYNIDGYIDTFDIMDGGYNQGAYTLEHRVKPHFWRPHHTDYDTFKYGHPGIIYKDFRGMSDEEIFNINLDYLRKIMPREGYEFLVIDGDHSYKGASIDLEYCKLMAADDAVLICDDLCDIRLKEVRRFYEDLPYYKYDFSDWNAIKQNPLVSMGVFQLK